MRKITGLSHLFKWENLHNWGLTKYFFAPLYMKTPPVGRQQPMTVRPQYKGRRENTSSSSSSSLTGLFEACILVRVYIYILYYHGE